MNDRIEVGDLVQVVRPTPCCKSLTRPGRTFRVAWIVTHDLATCHTCGAVFRNLTVAQTGVDGDAGYVFGQLIRLPPLAELEGERVAEGLGA